MKASVVYYPNIAKKNSKTGKIPMYMRVCYQRTKAESRLNAELNESEVDKWNPVTMRFMERNCSVNHILNRLDQKFNDFLILNAANLQRYTAANLKDYVLGNDTKPREKLIDFVDSYFQKAVANNVNRTAGTVKNYRKAINHLIAFLQYTKKELMSLDELNVEFAQDFKNFLVSSNISIKRKGMTEVSAAGIIKKFRTIFTQAVDQDILKRNSFKLVKIKTKSPRRERLTIEQVQKIYTLDLTFSQHTEAYRDVFLFSIFTGLAYHDAMSLTWNNIEVKKDGNYKLTIHRQKTDVITESFLPLQAIALADKYRNYQETIVTNSVMPKRSNKELNKQLKVIANKTGININLSTHIARHTFRQLLAEAGIADYGIIKRMMGQSRNGDVDEIYYSVTESGLQDAKGKFERFLTHYLSL